MRILKTLRGRALATRRGVTIGAVITALAAGLASLLPTSTSGAWICSEYDAATWVVNNYRGVQVLNVFYDPGRNTFWVRVVDQYGNVSDIPVGRNC